MRMVLIKKALKLIYDYLNGRSQKIKVGCYSFNSELDISYGVPQGSILGPLLLNIDVYDFLLLTSLLTLQIMLMTPLLTNVINTVRI